MVSQLRRGEWVVPIIFSALAVIAIVVLFNDEDLRTLYPIGPTELPRPAAPGTVAALGVAIYVAGAGVAAAFIGSVLLRPSPYDDVPDEFVERAQGTNFPTTATLWYSPGSAADYCPSRSTGAHSTRRAQRSASRG